MWQLTKLTATNICAFEELEYSPVQNQATLLFGNNLDNESQNSNGSGKSALIEALAIGILGEPLRKVNADEIINDRFSEATVSIIMSNGETGKQMTVNRRLSRKAPQDIQIFMQYAPDSNEEEVKQATVADYNKYVLEQIGLSKDDILHNFILTARKYQSFLSSSDKDKKEIINRFSNGIMVDESIEALRADIEPLQKTFSDAENDVSKCIGRVSALADEIERLVNEEASNKHDVQMRIASIHETIAQKRSEIRDWNKKKDAIELHLDILDRLDAEMQQLEGSDTDTTTAFKTISNRFAKERIPAISDYASKIEDNLDSLKQATGKVQELKDKSESYAKRVAELEREAQDINASNEVKFKRIDAKAQKLEEEIIELRSQVRKLKAEENGLMQERSKINTAIANMEKQLAGVIECPKCHYEFTLGNNLNVDDARHQLSGYKTQLKDVEKSIVEVDEEYAKCVDSGKAKANEQVELKDKKLPLQQAYNEAKLSLMDAKNEQVMIHNSIEAIRTKLASIQDAMVSMRKKMFDEVFDTIDAAIKNDERDSDSADRNIQMLTSAIKTYEEQIERLQSAMNGNELERLKESKSKYEQGLKRAEDYKESVSAELNTLKIQEATFVEFKTYLANTKINAISQITNDFLEAIGSDIRVNLSGYTILKSGKVRDKISVSLIRDGIDCGSFDKFSAGEKCRVELASVLALHKLSNVNCDEGKGLNLLVIDEILDCTDETGLANVFKALNDTQVTALVVSHGNVAENYPNRLVVTKQNGISFINENRNQ